MQYAWYVLFTFLSALQSIATEKLKKYTTIEHAQMYGYPTENHYITTEDGYILNVHRIPFGKQGQTNGKVVFLQHGLYVDSSNWVLLGPGKALAYILADEGYDVWMGNTRGNVYGRNHTTLDPDSEEFWVFTVHEIGVYDLPATIDYILANTGAAGIYYCAHSQGTTSFYIMGSERPDYNNKVIVYVHQAPMAYLNHLISPIFRTLAGIEAKNPNILPLVFGPEFLKSDGVVSQLASKICENLVGAIFCENLIYSALGFSPDVIEPLFFEQIAEQYPSGCSTQQIMHYLQLYNSGSFGQYDHGTIGNMERYGQLTPPNYNLSAVTAPGYLMYAMNDWLSDYEIDVPRLYDELGNCLGAFLNLTASFNHIDYLFSESAIEVNKQIAVLLSKH